jgi:hypothetical protein
MAEPNFNPYAAPTDQQPAPLDATGAGLLVEEVTAYVGRNARYYNRVWTRLVAEDAKGLAPGFNVAAFFLSLGWLLYRKMYREFFIAAAPAFLLGVATELVHVGTDGEQALERIINIGTAVAVGRLGNTLYFWKMRRAVMAARRAEPDLPARLAHLRRRGGASWLAPIVLVLVVVGVLGLSLWVS